MMRRRWSDTDRYFGPFTYASESAWRPFAMMLVSGDDEDRGAYARFSAAGRTLLIALPRWLIRPAVERCSAKYWDAATIARLGRDWYEEIHRRQYGIQINEGHLMVYLGRQTHSSDTTQSWSCFLPWTQWRHVRQTLCGIYGEPFWTDQQTGRRDYEAARKAAEACPSVTFAFRDYDGEPLTVRTYIDEREWHRGEGWFRWLAWVYPPMIRRYLELSFSGETGRRKGSWKGGTLGHSIEMLPGEGHRDAFRRYCAKHEMTLEEPT